MLAHLYSSGDQVCEYFIHYISAVGDCHLIKKDYQNQNIFGIIVFF